MTFLSILPTIQALPLYELFQLPVTQELSSSQPARHPSVNRRGFYLSERRINSIGHQKTLSRMGDDFWDGIRKGNLAGTEPQWVLREGKY